jgi:predicted nuclease with TOPRIM domain
MQELLEQLKQTLEGYHSMRAKFEKLQSEVEALETEKVWP